MSEEPFRVEVTIAAPVDEVWRSLREPELIRHWHGWEYDDGGGLDKEIEEIFRQDVQESEADHTLIVQGGDTFTLHSLDDGRTLVRMVRAPRGTNPDWDAFYEDINEGWRTFMQQLRFALERHPGSARRTVFLDGTLDSAANPLEELGLAGKTSTYTADLLGERASGALWYRSANQTGFTVDSWGDGLLIIAVMPVSPMRPTGGVMAVLTTYGLDDSTFEALRHRWTQWWRARYPEAKAVPQS
jgi:uncharacterized protein YndB with AHSA1/START domain